MAKMRMEGYQEECSGSCEKCECGREPIHYRYYTKETLDKLFDGEIEALPFDNVWPMEKKDECP